MTSPHVQSVNLGTIKAGPWGSLRRTAIDKRPVNGPVRVRTLGIESDQIADTKHHGGVDQAVYAYAREDLDDWQEPLGRDLRNGQFGENLTTYGVDVTGAVIGERWRIGTALMEVATPRIPCSTFKDFMHEPRWVRRFTEHGRPGAYLRVVEEGVVCAGDPVEVVARPAHGVTIGETFRALTGDRGLVPRLLEAPELPAEKHEYARRVLSSMR